MTFSKPLDWILGLIVIGLGCWICITSLGSKGSIATVFVANKKVAWVALDEAHKNWDLETEVGRTHIVREHGKIRVTKPPCRHKICEKQGWINQTHQKIICVPGRLLIKVEGENSSKHKEKKDLDAVSF